MIDYHVHLWPHGRPDAPVTVDELARYWERASAAGLVEIAFTEHLFRFRSAREAVGEFWREEGEEHLAPVMAAYWEDHAQADLDAYVGTVLAAQEAGLPVRLGLEVDHYPGRMDRVARLLAGYPFDVLLGSVHWLGNWMFDFLDDPASAREWDGRPLEEIWTRYTEALEELAGAGVCDVLAHPDLVKVAGRRPSDAGLVGELNQRMAQAAADHDLAAEVSSAGWRKPAAEAYPSPDLLGRLVALGVPLTLASDTHGPDLLAYRQDDLRTLLTSVGCQRLATYRRRRRLGLDCP